MKKLTNLILIALLTLAIVSCVNETENIETPEINLTLAEQELIESGNQFGLKLFKEINATDGDQNIFISPLSISMALGMTYNGANNETKDAMHSALEYSNLSVQEINESYKSIIDLLYSLDPQVAMKLANAIWANQNLTFIPEFIQANQDYFYAEVANVDFGDPATTDLINNWVNNSTDGKIDKILYEPLDPITAMVLANAIYFKGDWARQFDPELTYSAQFTNASGSQTNCMMMSTGDTLSYFENDLFQAVDLPYGNGDYSMSIFLPKQGKDVEDVIANLSSANYDSWINSFQTTQLELRMPKFKVEYEITLNDVLSSLGMGIAFTTQADFTNMHAPGGLFISLVKHKSFVEVNEEGTEAAAVTVVVIELSSIQGNYMTIDRPFFFVIRENKTQIILFMGKIVEPIWSD